MVGVEHRARMFEIQIILRLLRPRQIKDALDVRLRHRLLVRTARQRRKPPDLLVELFAHRLRQRLLLHPLAIFCGEILLAVAEFLLHGAQLLSEHELALVLLHGGFDLARNAALHLHDVHLALNQRQQRRSARFGARLLQKLLLVLQLHGDIAAHRIGKRAERRRGDHALALLGGQAVLHIRKCQKRPRQAAPQRLGHGALRLLFLEICNFRFKAGRFAHHVHDACARRARHQQANRIPLNAEHLPDAADGTNGCKIVRMYVHQLRIRLCAKQRKTVRSERLFDGTERFLPADIAMNHLARQHGKPAQRNDRQFFIFSQHIHYPFLSRIAASSRRFPPRHEWSCGRSVCSPPVWPGLIGICTHTHP